MKDSLKTTIRSPASSMGKQLPHTGLQISYSPYPIEVLKTLGANS